MWKSTTARFVRVNGVWLRTGAITAVERATDSKARVHLGGGTTVDVPLRDGQRIDFIIEALTEETQ